MFAQVDRSYVFNSGFIITEYDRAHVSHNYMHVDCYSHSTMYAYPICCNGTIASIKELTVFV